MVSRARLDEYADELNAVSELARRAAEDAYAAMRAADPNAPVSEVREGIKGLVRSAVESYGAGAAQLACELFNELSETAGADVEEAVPDELGDEAVEAIDNRARYIVGALVDEREDI